MWQGIKRFFGAAAKSLGQAIKAFVNSSQFREILATAEGQIASAVVAEVAGIAGLTNEQRRNEAFARIVGKLTMAGIEFTTSSINLAIELSVQKLKAGV